MYTPHNYACQPGFNASCALCCGSHNYRGSYNEIDTLFRRRLQCFSNMLFCSNDLTAILQACFQELSLITLPPHDPHATQCPFVAYTDTSYTTIGCLLYPYCNSFDYRSLFMGSICNTFCCRVNSPEFYDKVKSVAKLCGDWYYYSLIIHDMKLVETIVRTPTPDSIETCKQNAVMKLLSFATAF